MMPIDNERREVARKLRELGGYVFCPENTYELLADALGVDDFKGTDELFARLADLIEPSRHECVPGECPINVRHDNDRVDRDALLALADDIDKQTDGSMFDIWLEDGHYIARRIRKALGVDDGA